MTDVARRILEKVADSDTQLTLIQASRVIDSGKGKELDADGRHRSARFQLEMCGSEDAFEKFTRSQKGELQLLCGSLTSQILL